MKYSLSFLEEDYENLVAHLFRDASVEQAAYLLCASSVTDEETRLLVRELIPVLPDEIEEASAHHMRILPLSYGRALKRADARGLSFVFVHSHPRGECGFSRQDDIEEQKLFRTAHIRVHGDRVHGSLVFPSPTSPIGRVWLSTGNMEDLEVIRTLGSRFSFHFRSWGDDPVPEFFDRQVKAFGPDFQRLLMRLHIGIVGLGGTGSSVAEQLARLGVAKLTIADFDSFDPTNVNRLYGSRVDDAGMIKTEIAKRHIQEIGLGTQVDAFDKAITFESVARRLRNCDIIFCCTDDEWGRSILNRLAIYYYIPVFDMGVRIDSGGGAIRAVEGRVTTLMPRNACLFCRERINAERIATESVEELDPAEANRLRQEGYIPELKETRAPAVIPFTTTVAASAVSELIHRLTGYMGTARASSEILHQFDQSRTRTNSRQPKEECFCNDRFYFGRGDKTPFLDLTWRPV